MPKLHIPVAVPPGSKWCHRCKSIHPIEAFRRDRSRKDGLRSYCRPCNYAIWLESAEKRKVIVATFKRMTNPCRLSAADQWQHDNRA